MKNLTPLQKEKFVQTIWEYYERNKRSFDWRETNNPYYILVSEVMLQQTQTTRVKEKYKNFIKKFPTLQTLSAAPLREVLSEWQGLGYNRRALFLKKTAEAIIEKYNGIFPQNKNDLLLLPGIGQSTAGAILNFAFNTPTPFIETNIRTVYIYFFFKKFLSIHDKEILHLIEQTIDQENPKDWFYALYDYGTMLKSEGKELRTLHQKSAHYKKQSVFIGSNREIRSHILKLFIESKAQTLSLEKIVKKLNKSKEQIEKNLIQMTREGLLIKSRTAWKLI